jgi:hypothetical protein
VAVLRINHSIWRKLGSPQRERRPLRVVSRYEHLSDLDRAGDRELPLKWSGGFMKRSFRNLLVLSFALSVLAQTSPGRAPFTITISAVRATVRAGDEVEVLVSVKNLTNREMDFSANISDLTGIDPNYVFEVSNDRGSPASRRAYPHPELATGHAVFRKLQPGATITDTEPVSRLFDMTKPGKYIIQVSRRISDDKSEGTVRSNKITITVAQ